VPGESRISEICELLLVAQPSTLGMTIIPLLFLSLAAVVYDQHRRKPPLHHEDGTYPSSKPAGCNRRAWSTPTPRLFAIGLFLIGVLTLPVGFTTVAFKAVSDRCPIVPYAGIRQVFLIELWAGRVPESWDRPEIHDERGLVLGYGPGEER